MKYKRYVVASMLVLIFLLGLFLRLYDLGTVPFGFHSDEVDVGYVGRYILLHGKDTYGNAWPLSFDRFGDARPTGIFYLAGMSEAVFGVNEFAVRFPSAFFGALTVIAIYFLSIAIFRKPIIGLFAAFFLAVVPWHVNLSRATSESIIAAFLIVVGITLLVHYLEKRKIGYILIAFLLLGISYFFYHTARILVPLIVFYFVGFVFLQRQKLIRKAIVGGLFFVFIILTYLFVFGNVGGGGGRVSQVAFWNLPAHREFLSAFASADGQNSIIIARIFHNKVVFLGRYLVEEYSNYFSGKYLLTSGGQPPRYEVPGLGLIFIVQFPLLFFGLYCLFAKKDKSLPFASLAIYLLLVAPLPATMTWNETPNIQRSSFLVIPLMLIAGYGLYEVVMWTKKNKRGIFIASICVGIFVYEIIYAQHQYFVHHSQYKSYARDDGEKELMGYIQSHASQYDNVYLHRNIHPLFYLFYTKNFDKRMYIPFNQEPKLVKIDNVSFVAYPEIGGECVAKWEYTKILTKKQIDPLWQPGKSMVVDTGVCPNGANDLFKDKLVKLADINRKDTTHAFSVYTFKDIE